MTDNDETPGDRSGAGDGVDRRRAWLTGAGLGVLAIAALAVAFTIGTNYSDDPAPPSRDEANTPTMPTEYTGPGKELFAQRCGGCHTLSDAGTTGTAGPDLDTLKPPEDVVVQAIEKGGTGTGSMPPGLATGDDATQIAEYVAATAGG